MSAVVVDVETTGFSPHQDRIIEIAVVDFETEVVLLHTHLDPERAIPEEITRITGIADATVVGKPKFADVAEELVQIITRAEALVGYNVFFDRGMIAGELRRLPVEVSLQWPTLVCAKRCWDINEPKEQRHLQNAFRRFVHVDGFEGAHGALADTLATTRVLKAQIASFGLEGKTWAEFDPDQKRWVGPSDHVVAVDGVLVMNFGKMKGTPCHEVDAGYWKWLVRQDFPIHVKEIADFIVVARNGKSTAEDLYNFSYGRWM